MKLYYDPVTVNCRKVLAGLDLIGAAFNEEKVDYFGGGHTSPEYTAINPNQSLPTLVDDGFTVWESNAILQYAADKHEIFRRRKHRRSARVPPARCRRTRSRLVRAEHPLRQLPARPQ